MLYEAPHLDPPVSDFQGRVTAGPRDTGEPACRELGICPLNDQPGAQTKKPAMEIEEEGVPLASTADVSLAQAQQPLMQGAASASAPDPRLPAIEIEEEGVPQQPLMQGAAPAASAPAPRQPAMEVFSGKQFVRLRNGTLRRGRYACADEDGRSVSLSPHRYWKKALWAVELYNSADGLPYVLLRGAYGRYLGGPAAAAAQRDFDVPQTQAIMWRAVGKDGDAVLLHDASGRYLHTNSRRRPWSTGVYVSTSDSPCTESARQWVVEAVPRPTRDGHHDGPLLEVIYDTCDVTLARFLASVCPRLELCIGQPKREIRWVLADDDGNFDDQDWTTFQYIGRNAFELEIKLVALQPTMRISDRLTLCIRAGHHGQLTPLMIDLPNSREPLDIVLVKEGTPAFKQIVLPGDELGTDDDDARELRWFCCTQVTS